MPHRVQVIHAHEFVRAKPEGELDLAESEAVLAAIVRSGGNLEDFEILIDTRNATGVMSATDLWFLAERAARHREVFRRKTAVLCPLDRFDRARFFALCADNRGLNVQAFTSYEQAMEWLIAPDSA